MESYGRFLKCGPENKGTIFKSRQHVFVWRLTGLFFSEAITTDRQEGLTGLVPFLNNKSKIRSD